MQHIIAPPHSPISPRVLGSTALAAAITFALFVLMHKLTSQDAVPIVEVEELPSFDVVMHIEEPIVHQDKKLPEPPKVTKRPEVPKMDIDTEPSEPNMGTHIAFHRPAQDKIKLNTDLGSGVGDARPIIRIPPKYPTDAARQGVQGWVELEFTIDATGAVKNIKVTDAEPKRVFEKEAKRALKQWKYKPQFVNGKPVDQPGMQVVLDFTLES